MLNSLSTKNISVMTTPILNKIELLAPAGHFEMLEIGKKALEGNSPKVEILDPAFKILLEASKRAGVQLNEKQRDNVLKIIRKELKKNEETETENMTEIMKAFNEE